MSDDWSADAHAERMRQSEERLAELNRSIEAQREQRKAAEREQADRLILTPQELPPVAPRHPAPKAVRKRRGVDATNRDTIAEIAQAADVPLVPIEAKKSRNPSRRKIKDVNDPAIAERVVSNRDAATGKLGPGNNNNPWGRRGKDGKQGFSFRTGFDMFVGRLTEEEKALMWQALFQKAAQGDVQSMKLLLQYNKELDNAAKVEVEADTGVRISLTMPPMES